MTTEPSIERPRVLYLMLIFGVIVLGLASRRFDMLLPGWMHKNTGDVLWATMVFFLFGLLLPKWPTARIALLAAAFSVGIEFIKPYHAPWLDAVRNTILGRLIFGYVFSWSNLLCYLIGIGLGVLLERGLLRLLNRSAEGTN